ncbi:MAG: hypothetical protein ACMG6S_22075 [Byssovorax sp.]
MMNSSLSALFDIYVFPTGRRLFALGQVAARAKAHAFPELGKHCAGAVAHDRECLALERRWEGLVAESRGKAPPKVLAAGATPDAASVDPLVDNTLTAIRDHAVSQTAGAPADDPIHATVAAFLKAIYPAGVQEVTKLGFVLELAAVDAIVDLLLSKEHAPVVKELGLGRLATRLADLAVVYRAAIGTPDENTLVFGDVRAARIHGQDLLLEAMAMVLGKHHGTSAADVAARDDLLGPILAQNEAIGAAMKARRTVVDVNPETGVFDPNGTSGGTPGAEGGGGKSP